MHTSNAIQINTVTKIYADRTALDSLDLAITKGSRTVILGHNGAGKSTLLEIIATLRTPTQGNVEVFGHNSSTQPRAARRLIGLAPQSNGLDPLGTVTEVLRFQGAALGLSRKQSAARAAELINMFGLAEHRTRRVAQLSGGTRRKVDLAVALVGEPAIIILDEPTTGLDPMSRIEFWDELMRLNASGTTLIMSTQDLHEAEVLATDIKVIRQGKLAAQGTPQELKERVGQRSLVVTLDSEEHASVLISSTNALSHIDIDEPKTARLPLTDAPDSMAKALGLIHPYAPFVTQLNVTEPTLDDVFVAIAAR